MAELNDDKAQDAVNGATDGIHSTVNKAAETVSGLVGKASSSASEAVGSATSAVNDAVDSAQQNVSAGLRQASEGVADISDKATGAVKKYPVRTVLLVATGAAVAGFIVGVATSRRS